MVSFPKSLTDGTQVVPIEDILFAANEVETSYTTFWVHFIPVPECNLHTHLIRFGWRIMPPLESLILIRKKKAACLKQQRNSVNSC